MKTVTIKPLEVPPDWLDDRAKEIYAETVVLLGKQGMVSDRFVVADYAQACSDVERFTIEVRLLGETLTSAHTGAPYQSPTVTMLMNRRKDVFRLRDDLGMTPKARKSGVKSTKENPLLSAMKRV